MSAVNIDVSAEFATAMLNPQDVNQVIGTSDRVVIGGGNLKEFKEMSGVGCNTDFY